MQIESDAVFQSHHEVQILDIHIHIYRNNLFPQHGKRCADVGNQRCFALPSPGSSYHDNLGHYLPLIRKSILWHSEAFAEMALERMNYSEGQQGDKMMPGQDDIVMAIREAFDQLRFFYRHSVGTRVWVPWQEDPLEGQNGWTTAVKTTLCRVGREQFGFSVGCHGVPVPEVADYGEWLWDISWCREGAQGRMADLPLVAECEWTLSSAAIIEDFQKLLVACAGVRLMIHEHWTDREEIPDPPSYGQSPLRTH